MSIDLAADEIKYSIRLSHLLYEIIVQTPKRSRERTAVHKIKIIEGMRHEEVPQADASEEQQSDAPVEPQPAEVKAGEPPEEHTASR